MGKGSHYWGVPENPTDKKPWSHGVLKENGAMKMT